MACVAPPTNLTSLYRLHLAAPGHVYIHLGGTTPEEKKVGRALMHSKVFLAEGEEGCRLWVGSHNLTAMAIEGGNYEAGVVVTGPASSGVMQDAIAHLQVCRNTAELFDPDQMERYEDIQRGWGKNEEWESERNVLVIHAQAPELPSKLPFILHINVLPTDLDRMFRMEGPARLYLHEPGRLIPGKPVDRERATLWQGTITAVVRTEHHPKNRGARAQFDGADYDIDIVNLETPPFLAAGGRSSIKPKTQVVIRADRRGEAVAEFYSLADKSPVTNVLASAPGVELHEVDEDMREFFTPKSVSGQTLVYRPVVGMRPSLSVSGYDDTVRATIARMFDIPVDEGGEEPVEYAQEEPKNPIDPFFFLSKYAVRRKRPSQGERYPLFPE